MPFVVTYCAFKIHRVSGPGRSRSCDQPRRTFRTCIYACAQLIGGLGHANRSATVPVSRSQTQSFQEKHLIIFQARVVLQMSVLLTGRLVACSARISVDRQTDTQTKYSNPRWTCAPKVTIEIMALIVLLLVPHIMILLSWFSLVVTDSIGMGQLVWSSPSGSSSDIKRSSAQLPG